MLSGLRKPLRFAVFISGSGSTLQSLMEMSHQFEVGLVVSNRPSALGVLKARRFGKPVLVIHNPIDYDKLHGALLDHRIDRIMLAGFMKILPAGFVEKWAERMMNIHPSLLPKYPGLHSDLRSWQDQEEMGVSLHQVNEHMDEGNLFLQQSSLGVPALKNCSFEDSEIFLRRTEQHLLRELAMRWN